MTPHYSFHKMHGAGNDFVLFDATKSTFSPTFDFAKAAQLLCDRHFGVGGDGLLTLEPSSIADLKMRMWNPDGSEDMCGNGLRCVAALAWRQKYVQKTNFTVETLAGLRKVEAKSNHIFTASMGQPNFDSTAIPIKIADSIEYDLQVENRTFRATSVSTGSSHTVIFLKYHLSENEFQFFSPKIENHPLFPNRTSIMWAVETEKNHFSIRIWERGAGETLACGTGACAVGAAAKITSRGGNEVLVESKGGILIVNWNSPDEEILLTGPATYLYEGTWHGDLQIRP
jgi:diaminopimelate epimerase